MSSNGDKLILVLRRHLRFVEDTDVIPPDADLTELGLDSMNAVDLVLDLEDALDVCFPDSLLTSDTMRTVRSLRAAVQSLEKAE